jgi:carbamoyl-phosphate synthase large subunit
MRSTGEVMGIDRTFAAAYAKAQIAAGQRLPTGGKVFVSMADKYKQAAVPIAQQLVNLGYSVVCTTGAACSM